MKSYFKKITLIFCSLLTVITFCSCKEKETLSPADISEKIVEENTLTELSPLSGEKLYSYFEFKNSDVNRFSVMISNSTENSDTVAVFEVKDEDSRSLVVTGISKYIDKLSNSMRTVKNEHEKVSSRVLMEVDDLIILVISSCSENVEKQLSLIGAKAIY